MITAEEILFAVQSEGSKNWKCEKRGASLSKYVALKRIKTENTIQEVLLTMENKVWEMRELYEMMGLSKSSMNTYLKKLIKQGLVNRSEGKIPHKFWRSR